MKKFALLLALSFAAASANANMYQLNDSFEGWQGESVYELTDGHVIKQSSYTYCYSYSYRPNVLIYKDGGHLKAHVEGASCPSVSIDVLN
jgi:hypothetical protein